MFLKLTTHLAPIKRTSHAPKKLGLLPFKIKFCKSYDGWSGLVTHHVWLYTAKGARFVKLVRPRTTYEQWCHEANVLNDQIRRDEMLARKNLEGLARRS